MLMIKRTLITTLLLSLIGLFACMSSEQSENIHPFQVTTRIIDCDTPLSDAIFYNNYILCLREDGKLFVLDTAFGYNDSLTQQFSKFYIAAIQQTHDTLMFWVGNDFLPLDSFYYLHKNWTLTPYHNTGYPFPVKDWPAFYNDSDYYAYGGSFGEFGGSVFFYDKHNRKTYSYPASSVQQVVKMNGQFMVSCFSAHVHKMSEYIEISNPRSLYELTDEEQKINCQWYCFVDSLSGSKYMRYELPGVRSYSEDSFSLATMASFPYHDTMYSIFVVDSATILARHQDGRLIPVDTLLERTINFYQTRTHITNGTTVTALRYFNRWGWPHSENGRDYMSHMGLIVIKDGEVAFVDFRFPRA